MAKLHLTGNKLSSDELNRMLCTDTIEAVSMDTGVEHEDVSAEVEVDVGHLRLDRDVAGDGFSAVGYDESEESLAAALDVGIDAVFDVALTRAYEVIYLLFHI